MKEKIFLIFAVVFSILLCHNLLWAIDDADLLDEAAKHYEQGNRFYQMEKFDEAIAEYEKANQLLRKQLLHRGFAQEPVLLKEASIFQTPQSKKDNFSQIQKNQSSTTSPNSKLTQVQTQIKTSPNLEYTLEEKDELYITVWENPDLNQEVIVRPDGKISFSLIGDIPALGLTISELKESITERLKEFIKNPVVSISLRKMAGAKIIILGEVVNPGVYNLSGSKSLLEAIGLAGGFTKDAVASSVVVIKNPTTNPQAMRLNLNKALKGDATQNIMLAKEDVVFVPKKFIADLNYFLSQIIEPIARGAYTADVLNNF